MRSAEFQTHGMSRLNATKFIATFHSARYREPRLAFAQQALDENPTLHSVCRCGKSQILQKTHLIGARITK